MGMGGWMWLVVIAGLVAIWVVVVIGVRAMTRGTEPKGPAAEAPLAILDRRLAAGEISIEEYHQVRRTLIDGH